MFMDKTNDEYLAVQETAEFRFDNHQPMSTVAYCDQLQ